MSKLKETKITSENLLTAKIINVRRDKVLSPKGECYREVVEHSGGVAIVAFMNDTDIILIRQWRYPINQEILELPAGKLEKEENPLDCAKRELVEETGYQADSWTSLGYIHTTPGFCDEKLYLYKATNLKFVGTNFDEFELVENYITSLENVLKMIKQGTINDAKTICGISKILLEKNNA